MHANPWFTLPSHGKTWITFRHSSGCRSFGYLTMVSCLGPSPTQHRNPGTARMLLLLCPQPETPHTSKLPRIQRSSLRHTAAPRGEVECLKQTWKRLTCVGYLPVPTCQPNIRFWCFSTVASSWLLAWQWLFLFGWLYGDYIFERLKSPSSNSCLTAVFFPCKYLVMTRQLHFSQWLLVYYLPLQNRGHP